MIDSMSDHSYILESTRKDLNVNGPSTTIEMSTMTSVKEVVQSTKVFDLLVRGFNGQEKMPLPGLHSRDIMPANRAHIPQPEMVNNWPHLHSIRHKIMPLMDFPIALLLGYDSGRPSVPRDIKTLETKGPFAQRYDLGWGRLGLGHRNRQ